MVKQSKQLKSRVRKSSKASAAQFKPKHFASSIYRPYMAAMVFVLLFGGIGVYLFGFSGATAGRQSEITSGVTGWCLNNANDNNQTENTVNTAKCNGDSGQNWTVDGNLIRHTSRTWCLEPKPGVPPGGVAADEHTPIVIGYCNGRPSQNWVKYNGGYMNSYASSPASNTNKGTKFCLAMPNGQTGAQLQLQVCNDFTSQNWTPSTYTPQTATAAYQNPFRAIKNLTLKRIDEGVDFRGSGKVYALGAGQIVGVKGRPGSHWGTPPTFIVEHLTAGPASGKYVYVAESCTPLVRVGQKVTTSDAICTMRDIPEGIETGWAQAPSHGDIAMAHGCYIEGSPTTWGVNYANLLHSLGQKTDAPAGKILCGPTGLANW